MRRYRVCWLVSAVVAGLVVAVGPPAVAATGWSPAVQVATSSYGPSIAVDAAGDAVAGWCDSSDHPTATYRPAAGSWDTPTTLETGNCSTGEPRLAIDANGEVIAVWASNSEIHAAIRTAGVSGTWGGEFLVSDVSGGPECLNFCTNPRVAVDSAGRATVVWQGTFQDGIFWAPNAQLRTVDLPGGTLNPAGGPVVLSGTQHADSITLAENAPGAAAIAWLDTTTSGTNAAGLPLWVTTLDTTALPLAPTTPFEVSTHDGLGSNSTETLDIAIAPSGWVSAAYPVDPTNDGSRPCPNTGCDLDVRDRAPDTGNWSTETQLATGASFTTHQLAFAPDGSEVLAWGDYSLACSGSAGTCLMHANIRASLAAAWGSASVISSRPVYTDGPQPAVTADAGSAFTVAWSGKDTTNNVALPEAARYDSGVWDSEHDLGAYGAGTISDPVVDAAGPAGTASALWSDGGHLWESDYSTATPHTLTVATSPGTGAGTVTSSSPGIDCGATCSAQFADGTPLTLTATPGAGSVFSGWSGGGCTGTSTCQINLTADTTITPTFTARTALSIGASKTINYGSSVTLSTTLTNNSTGHPIPSASLVLQAKAPSSTTWNQITTRTTSSTGTAAVVLTPHATTQYRWRYQGTGYVASTSATETITVRQVVLIHTTKTSVLHGIAFKIYGTVKPSSSGQKVYLQRLFGTTWKTIGYAYLKKQKLPNGTTTVGYLFTTKVTTKGTTKFRVMKPATATLTKGISAILSIKIT